MDQVSVFDAKNKLSALLQRVERGGEVTITRRGKAVAKLVPAGPSTRALGAVQRLRALRESIAARGGRLSVADLKALRDEGRR